MKSRKERQSLYISNHGTIKDFGNGQYEIVINKMPIRRSGYEIDTSLKTQVNNEKLSNNIASARVSVYEIAMCNDFNYFVTLTLDKKKQDRANLKAFITKFNQFIRNQRRNNNSDIQYLLVPEKHKDGKSWHMHGLIKGIPKEQLSINKNGYLDWNKYSNSFGYISLGKVRNKKAVSKYITKYISKDFGQDIAINKNSYYSTRGLKRPNNIFSGQIDKSAIDNLPREKFNHFENEYTLKITFNEQELEKYKTLFIDN